MLPAHILPCTGVWHPLGDRARGRWRTKQDLLPPLFVRTSSGQTRFSYSLTCIQRRFVVIDEEDPVPRRAAFTIEQFRTCNKLPPADNAFRTKGVKTYFGWDSVARMEMEYEASMARWFHLFSFHQPVDIDVLLGHFRANQPSCIDAARSFQRGSLSPLDIFALPFRHLTRAETMEELSVDYGIRYKCE